MASKPKIAIVGPGRLGRALAIELSRAGCVVSEIVSRNRPASRRTGQKLARMLHAQATVLANAVLDADIVWFCVLDREIATAAEIFSRFVWKGKAAFHSSGALRSDELRVLRRRGAAVASVHPLMTFVSGAMPSLRGVPFALEGDAAALRVAHRIVRKLGGEPFIIRDKDKVAYHAWGAFTSPLLVALLVSAEQVARAAGLSIAQARKRMMPIVIQTIANYGRLGPAGAFSGPLIRGDVEIVRRHLKVLRKVPEARNAYLALVSVALRHLPVQQRRQLQRALQLSAK